MDEDAVGKIRRSPRFFYLFNCPRRAILGHARDLSAKRSKRRVSTKHHHNRYKILALSSCTKQHAEPRPIRIEWPIPLNKLILFIIDQNRNGSLGIALVVFSNRQTLPESVECLSKVDRGRLPWNVSRPETVQRRSKGKRQRKNQPSKTRW